MTPRYRKGQKVYLYRPRSNWHGLSGLVKDIRLGRQGYEYLSDYRLDCAESHVVSRYVHEDMVCSEHEWKCIRAAT